MKFYVLSRDFGYREFYLTILDAEDEEEACKKIEEEIANTNSQDWLLSVEEYNKLRELLK